MKEALKLCVAELREARAKVVADLAASQEGSAA